MLSDSIGVLDSLVNALKITDNHLARGYARRSLSLALGINSTEALARAFLMIGVAYSNQNTDSSFIYFSKALRLATLFNLEQIKPKVYYNLAMIYHAASDLKMALLYLDSSALYSTRVKDFKWLSNTYNAMGNLKFDMLDSSNARVMFDSAYAIGSKHYFPKQVGVALASLAKFENVPEKLSRMQQSAIDILKKYPGNEEEIASIYVNLGEASTIADTAIKYYHSAIEIAHKGNSAEIEIAAYNNLAYSFIEKKEFSRAADCLNKYAIPLALRIGNFDWLSTLYDSYADVLISENKSEQAFFYAREALKAKAKADQIQATEQVRLLSVLLDVKSKELRIQKNELKLKDKDDTIVLILLGGSVFSFILLVVIFSIIWIQQRTRIKFQTEMIASAKRLLEAEENIKGRVSMELHDLATPFYTSMLQQIEEAQIQNISVEIDLKKKLSEIADGLRQLSHKMNNRFFEQLSITELLAGLCEDFKNVSNIPLHCRVGHSDVVLSPEETIHIYRIAQELFTNALKYLTSGEIRFSFSEQSGTLFIIYKDTGSGFDVKSAVSKGIGITNIFERAKLIHGKAILESTPGKGTNWIVSIPVKQHKKGTSN
jgi:signal transduction histidine kinase